MKLWIARDQNGDLFLYPIKPDRYVTEYYVFFNGDDWWNIDSDLFPADLHPVKKDYTFSPILRILDAIPTGIWKAKSKQCEIYAEKLAKNLESEGYLTDAALIREKIKNEKRRANCNGCNG